MIIPAVYALYPITEIIGATVDEQIRIRGSDGALTWVFTSNISSNVKTIGMLVILTVAANSLIRSITHRQSWTRLSNYAWTLPILSGLIVRRDWTAAIAAAAGTICLISVANDGITRKGIRRTALVATFTLLSSLVYAALNPNRAILECRPNKCTLLGGLLTSFMPQENVLAFFGALSIPLFKMAYDRHRYWANASLALSVVYLSGSRTALVAALVAVIFNYRTNHNVSTGTKKISGRWITISTIYIMTAASGIVFFYPSLAKSLTGRSDIYALLDHYFWQNPILGPGRGILTEAYLDGLSWGYLLAHEHGQMPYIFINGGILGGLLFIVLIAHIATMKRTTRHITMCATAAVFFVTEPIWTLDLRGPGFWALLLVVATSLGCNKSRTSLPLTEIPNTLKGASDVVDAKELSPNLYYFRR